MQQRRLYITLNRNMLAGSWNQWDLQTSNKTISNPVVAIASDLNNSFSPCVPLRWDVMSIKHLSVCMSACVCLLGILAHNTGRRVVSQVPPPRLRSFLESRSLSNSWTSEKEESWSHISSPIAYTFNLEYYGINKNDLPSVKNTQEGGAFQHVATWADFYILLFHTRSQRVMLVSPATWPFSILH